MEATTITGLRGGPVNPDAPAVYIAIGEDAQSLAQDYAGGAAVVSVSYEARNPLVLSTGAEVHAAWEQSGALTVGNVFYSATEPCSQQALNQWVADQGYDAIVVPDSAFEDEEGYEWAGGTFGEAQAVLLDPSRVVVS